MTTLPEMMPVSELRQDAATTIKRLQHSRNPIVITQRGRATAVLMSIESYERDEEERQLLRRLAKGKQEIQDGQGHTLDDVLAEANAILNNKPA